MAIPERYCRTDQSQSQALESTRIDQWSGEKRRIDSDLSAAVKNLRGRAVVVTDCCNEKVGGIGGVADTADFRLLHIRTETLAQPIVAGIERNGFDNFTGNSLSHFITPTRTIIAKSRGEIKVNPAGRSG